MKTKYHLEVYEADNTSDAAFWLESDTPFGGISVGDLMHHSRMNLNVRLQVTKIEHLFWEVAGSQTHKICVYTTLATH